MKGIVSALLLALVAVAANDCPEDWQHEEKLLVHEDCNKFYKCTYGEPVEMTCWGDLYFNVETELCDWQSNVDCGNRSTPGEERATTGSNATTAEPTTSKAATDAPTADPSFLDNGCPVNPHIHWLLPVEDDCNGFYYCVWGELVLTACPPTLHFNPTIQVCDWPQNAGCAASQSTTTAAPTNITTAETDTNATTTAEPVTNATTAEPATTEAATDGTTTDEPSTTDPTFLENGCPVNPYIHWLLPVEGDCNGFYYCVWGELVLRACPLTLHFNPKIQVCDWPQNAGCVASQSNTTITTAEPVTNATTTASTTTAKPDTNATTAKPTTTEAATDAPTAPSFLDNGCPVNPHIHWLLPVEDDCNGFYYCVWGELVLTACPPTLHFNPTIQVCDWPQNAGCGTFQSTTTAITAEPVTEKSTTTAKPNTNATTAEPTTTEAATDVPTTDEPTTTDPSFLENGCPVNPYIHWLLPVEGDCNGFYYCVWGELVLRACPPTLHFNPTIQVCDWPQNAGCIASQSTTTYAPTTITTAEPVTNATTTTAPTTITTAEPVTNATTTTAPTTITTAEPVTNATTTTAPTTITTAEPVTNATTTTAPTTITTAEPVTNATTTEASTTTGEPVTNATTAEPTITEAATDATTTDARTTTDPSFLENGCPANPHIHWLLPVEGDCNGFYYCVWGELVLRACPPTLHFNPIIQVCDWPQNAGCVTSQSTTTITTAEPVTNASTDEPTTADPSFLENGCPVNPHIHWLLPVEGDCNGFYYCVWGELVLRACPPTLHFNPTIQVCDWPLNAGCVESRSVNKHNLASYYQ